MEITKLTPVCKDYLWGGNKLRDYGKVSAADKIAESWELSFHKDGLSKVENGKTLAEEVGEKEIGENASKFPFFPVLTKFIDAKDNLSVQVHPSDEYALKNENSFGKTEMWYIVEAEENAGIYLGLKQSVTKECLCSAIENNTLTEYLNFFKVKKGEHYFIEAGTIHAIGKGVMIFEIQQNSNLTYRVFDYNRKDSEGRARELHIEKAKLVSSLDAFINNPLNIVEGDSTIIGKCKYFTTKLYQVDSEQTLFTSSATFKTVTVLEGNGFINNKPMNKGDTFFVPSNYGKFSIKGKLKIITVEI